MPDYTTTQLLNDIRGRAGAPNATAQGTTDTDLLRIATSELHGEVTAFVKRINTEHLLARYVISITNGVSSYVVPKRAIGGSLKDAVMHDTEGKPHNLRWMDVDQLPAFDGMTGDPTHFYFENQNIVLYPTPMGSGSTLSLPYYRRCSHLILPSACGTIVGNSTSTVTCAAAIPGTFTPGKKYDIVQSEAPFEILAMDIVATGTGSDTVAFADGSIPNTVAAGDYLCLANESPVIQLPEELHQFVSAAACVKLLSGPYGDQEQLQTARAELDRLRDEVLPDLMKERVSGEPIYMFNPYYFE